MFFHTSSKVASSGRLASASSIKEKITAGYYCKNQGNMRQAWLYTVNFWQTFLIQPLFLVVRVQQRYEELTGMGRGQLTWMLIACYCSCNQSIKDETAGQQKLKLSVHSNISTFWSHGLLTGRFFLRIRVKGATGD